MADAPTRPSAVRRQSSSAAPPSPRAPASASSTNLVAGSPRSPRLSSSWAPSTGARNSLDEPAGARTNRASVGYAVRASAGPQPVRRSIVGGYPSPTIPTPGTPPSNKNSPRVAQGTSTSPWVPATASPGGSPRMAFPTRSSSIRGSPAATGYGENGRREASDSAQEDVPTRSPKSSAGSQRRKPPPPLEFAYEPVSPTSHATAELSPTSTLPYSARRAVDASPSKAAQEEEERDTLSGLINFNPESSPVLTTDIPSSRLSLSDDVHGAADNDDTVGSGFSFLSSSASDSSAFGAADAARPYQSSSSSSAQPYNHGGVGLGLPFSMSASANLSSLGTSPFGASSTFSAPPPPLPSTSPTTSPYDPYRSPGGRSSGSPVADRGQLIGLGELATPRWTSGPLEKRWGVPDSEERRASASARRSHGDDFDVLGSYGLEHEPMPPLPSRKLPLESPTVARPGPRRSAERPLTTYDSPNRPFGGSTSSALYPPSLLPSSASSATISTDASPAALLNFGGYDPTAQTFGPLDFSGPTAPSPVYSLDAVSAGEDSPKQQRVTSAPAQETPRESRVASEALAATVRRPDVPKRRESRRKSFGAAASAPNSAAAGATWTTGPHPQSGDVIGLGFEHEIDVSAEDAAAAKARRRVSSGSVSGSSTSAKRSSTRSMSIDGKTSAKQHRRTSTGKGTFAHLPPSPAASTASHVFTSAGGATSSAPALPPLLPLAFPTPPAPTSAPPLPTSSASTPSGRTPDHSRLSRHSFHSHHSSPSLVAANILRHTRDLEGVDVDIQHAAATDEGTAAALAKLDGLSSPRMSRIASSSATAPGSESRSRKSSRGAGDAPPPNVRRDSSQSVKRRARSSTGESGAALAKEVDKIFGGSEAGGFPRSTSTSANVSPMPPPPALPSPSALPTTSPSLSKPKSPHSPSTSQFSSSATTRAASQNRPPLSASGSEIPFPSSSSIKRGSSSSASMTAGTWTSVSHDSTSATSLGTRSTASKYRRNSGGSDISSTHSNGERPPFEHGDSTGEIEGAAAIPPVPPLPKDWETYRPTTSGTSASASSAQNSPRIDLGPRRPSEASSFGESSGLPSPLAPPMQPVRTTSSSGRSGFESSLPVATTASGGTGRRKWSISSAFHKATKSPKASAVKESASFTDLHSAAGGRRERTTSFGQHLADSALPRRLAASTSDIASIASGKSGHETATAANTGSIGRSSIRSGKIPSFARTRTASQSSNSTTRTAQTASQLSSATAQPAAAPPPSVVATSPGRSRSSLINPRRTPSGIPFFSRKSSTTSDLSATTPSPNTEKGEFSTPSAEEKSSGRKSILGLNFLRSGGSKRDKDKGPLSPPASSTRSTFSSATSSATSSRQTESYGSTTDEFGRRASLATPKSTGLLTRKRGKTFSSADKGDVFSASQPVQLPPLQMNALPATTARRVDSMSSSKPPTSSSSHILQTPRTRTSKLQESLKVNLPTIAGSPSTHAFANGDESRPYQTGPSPSTTPPPKSHTPTKIPRLKGTSVGAPSPRTSPVASSTLTKPIPRRKSSNNSMLDSASLSSSAAAPSDYETSEFGAGQREPGLAVGEKTLGTRRRTESESVGQSQIPRSRSTTSGISSLSSASRTAAAKEALDASTSSRQPSGLPRAGRRPSTVEEEKRTPSVSSSRTQPRLSALSASTSRLPSQPVSDSSSASTVTALSASARKPGTFKISETTGLRRTSVPAAVTSELLATKSSKSLSSRSAVPSRVPKASTSGSRLSPSTTDSGRSSAASGSYGVDEDKVKGDEEMAAYVKRQIAKQVGKGVAEETVRKMFEFPDPTEPLPPLSSEDALSLYSRYLAPYEKEEIRDYPQVYFVGPNCDKKPATKEAPTNNFGYDDERGDYQLVMHDHIQFRYEVIDVLGKGSFGQVLQCRDHKTGEMVAVKIIRNKKRFHHQALVEIKVLENLVKWDPEEKHYVIRMVESFTFRGHLCIVTELLSINLYELVKANSFAGFSTTLIRRFASQILKSLILLYHHRVVHCDLKPENILLRHPAKSGIKVIDFGSSCFENEKVYTYIQSRFYRSPEVILGMNYHMGIDMWSLGCILAEMYTGYPIFPGENEQEQLACIMEVQGLPDRYLIDKSSRKRLFFDSTGAPRPVVNSKGRRRRPGSKTLEQVLRCQDELFVDFIAKCLAWDPDRRMKPEKALRHPWIAGARSVATIPARTSRTSSGLSSSTSSRTATGTTSHSSSPSISTPLKKLPTQASTSTAPLPRTRTVSYNSASLTNTATGATRLASKGSLGLPPSSRYSVKS